MDINKLACNCLVFGTQPVNCDDSLPNAVKHVDINKLACNCLEKVFSTQPVNCNDCHSHYCSTLCSISRLASAKFMNPLMFAIFCTLKAIPS